MIAHSFSTSAVAWLVAGGVVVFVFGLSLGFIAGKRPDERRR